MFVRILVPVDGSPLAEAVLEHLEPLVARTQAELLLVRAYMLPPVDVSYAALMAQMRADTERDMTALVARLKSRGLNARGVVREGFAADTILRVAEEEGASIIAMTTHGRSGLPHFVLGSVTEKVARASPVPVLIVRSFVGAAPARRDAIRRILLPVDGSDTSLQVVPAVAALAKALDATVVVLNVLEPGPANAAASPQIKEAYARLQAAHVRVEPALHQGDPASEILNACAGLDAHLIAMTTHGRSGLTRWALGSVTEKVLRAATVPLLVVRAMK